MSYVENQKYTPRQDWHSCTLTLQRLENENGSKAERNRSLILPERLNFPPGEDPSSLRGVTFGQVVIDRDGVIHARDFRKLPN